jgi:hypothetical protein
MRAQICLDLSEAINWFGQGSSGTGFALIETRGTRLVSRKRRPSKVA